MSEQLVDEDQTDINFVDHPDDQENELANDSEVDALIKGMDTSAPVLLEHEGN